MSDLKRENELRKVELSDSKTLNETLKIKLTEAQESLKSNENLITYLNKQLNEKPGLGGTAAILGSTQSSFGTKLSTGKPPAPQA